MAIKYKKNAAYEMFGRRQERYYQARNSSSLMKTLRIGMAGLDTSHVPAFAKILHDASDVHHVPGARITIAFPGGSPDFEQSISRVEGFTAELRDKHDVKIVSSLSDLRDQCDAIMLESIDGRAHLGQFREIADWGIPVFIDKPLTVATEDAVEIARIAEAKGVRVASGSALRFAETFVQAMDGGPVLGADIFGPMSFLEKCPGYFWYGIHSAEMLFAALGSGCREALAVREESHDIVVGRWADGRLGTLRGNRGGNPNFGGIIQRGQSGAYFDVSKSGKAFYISLLEQVIPFFRGEESKVAPLAETVEIIRFLEAANKSVASGKWEKL